MDPGLQLWVAACLYWGTADLYHRMYGPLTEAEADELYAESARFATTLQVRPSDWPADRKAFERYWDDALTEVSIDPPVREYLMKLVSGSYLPFPLNRTARFSTFVTTGFLPQRFRDEMKLAWSPADQHRFERMLGRLGIARRHLPEPVRLFPLNAFLFDLRRRLSVRSSAGMSEASSSILGATTQWTRSWRRRCGRSCAPRRAAPACWSAAIVARWSGPTSRRGRTSGRGRHRAVAAARRHWRRPQDLRTWVNSGLMTLFFLVVGLEARREFDLGDLRDRRRFLLPLRGRAGRHGRSRCCIYLAVNARRARRARLGRRDVDRHRARARAACRCSAATCPTGSGSSC